MTTKASGWTPGPWSVDARADLNTGELRYIIRAPIDGEDDDAFEEIAQIVNNALLARLMAAAPDMAELLERLEERLQGGVTMDDIGAVRALLAKIKGETNA